MHVDPNQVFSIKGPRIHIDDVSIWVNRALDGWNYRFLGFGYENYTTSSFRPDGWAWFYQVMLKRLDPRITYHDGLP